MFTEIDYAIIAQEALKKYDLEISEMVYLGRSGSVTFRVNTNPEGLNYLMKLHYSESVNKTKDVIESELRWLEALSNDTALIVPAPVRNRDNDLITVISCGTEEAVNVTCYHWVEGEQHSMQWEIPDGFVRPVYHTENLMSSLAQLHEQISSGLLTHEQFT